MRRLLTTVLALYWMTEFALLAGGCVGGFDEGLSRVFQMLGADEGPGRGSDGGAAWAAAFGAAFALVSLLFTWSLVTGDGDAAAKGYVGDTLKLAFAGSASVLTLLMLAGIALDMGNVLPAISVELIALLGSYLVMRGEHGASQKRNGAAITAASTLPRSMAMNAALQYSAGAALNMPVSSRSR